MSETGVLDRIAAYPELAAVIVLILGFIVARLLSMALGQLLAALDRRISLLATSDSSVLTPRFISISRGIVFWIAFVLAVAFALRVLGAGDTTVGLNNALIKIVPETLIAFAIIVAGHLLGVLISNLVAQLSEDLAADSPGPRLLYGIVLGISIVMALQHIGIDITFVTRLLLIVVAVGGGGLMLAFALGATRHVANLLAHRELSRISVGERIRVDDLEGTVVEIHSTAVDIATEDGIATVPAARFAEASVLRLREDRGDG